MGKQNKTVLIVRFLEKFNQKTTSYDMIEQMAIAKTDLIDIGIWCSKDKVDIPTRWHEKSWSICTNIGLEIDDCKR